MKAVFHGRGGKAPPGEALTPNSHQKQRMVSRGAKENVDPDSTGSLPENRTPSATAKPPLAPKIRSPLHPRPLPNPNDTPLKKKKLNLETLSENGAPAAAATESGVQVIVRMRPLNKEVEEEDQIVHKVSADSVSILDHAFTFDSVADTGSTQEEVFQLVGLPLVENCLAGFNSSIFAYGQTGSGKTYTMWGPTSAALEDGSSSAERGLTPRVFERLFSRIHEEQLKHSDKQLNYQCRCSFLEIREDVRTGVYVDCLSEEYVCTMKDVTRLLTKGLANRRTGATSINAESSRSHCVFTCVIESHSKSIADGLNSLKISRINLVDLAGSERQKLTGAAGERLKEAGNINRSLSQLGNVINILAEVSQTGKQRHIPYRDSKLTFLLQESLGGNAKLAMICAISPSQSCKNESFSTLRFAQRAKAIKNKAIINEISQDDVHVLREQIRQLKDELLRMKANGVSPEGNPNFSTGWNARRSLNLLRMSLGQRAVISTLDDDMDIDEDMDNPWMATNVRPAVSEPIQDDVPKISAQCVEEEDSSGDDKIVHKCMMTEETAEGHDPDRIVVQSFPQETVEDSSTFMCSYCRDRFLLESKPVNNDKDQQLVPLDDTGKKELQLVPADVIDNSEVQLAPEDNSDKNELQLVLGDATDNNKELGLADALQPTDKPKNQIPKAVENVLAGAIRREMALQEHCSRQTAEIVQLKRLIQQYKHERECNSIIAETREDKICRLENLMDGILPTEKFMEEEFSSLANEHKLLKEKYDNHPEVLRVNVELKRVKDELEAYRSFFDLGEREVLMEEIHELRDQLQYYITFSPFPSQKRSSLLQLAYLKDPIPDLLDDVPESTKESANENFEEERRLWAETESKWISLSEELGLKLEASRSLAEKLKMELDSEKKCSDELKEALQTAMQGHARILDQYADLQEKHIGMLIRHQQIRDGIEDVKRAAAKSGVKGAESKFINSLAAQISALKVEREKERQYWREENKVLQAQLRDTAEAVQAAGELVVRLKDAEEATASAQVSASEIL
ncbi:unnamed protein product [Spirodela intermedia]|uniref:Kinesin motor domain-containing protein n=1 Tax=Spirodela intermedia TaxID=51605 RepID=A0A7I8J1L0_SPIIN|nr:unnamed protein product [Spirodela intermedia]CAA6664106.1 unnamed protein product [Spirodela intermedia]